MQKVARPKLVFVRRFLQYGLVGGVGVIVDSSVLFVLADAQMLALPVFISKIVAAEIAMLNNFIWNDVWTFAPSGNQLRHRTAWLKRFLKFNLICTGGVLISGVVLVLLIKLLSFHLILGNLVAIAVGMVWNFGMNYIFTWQGMRSGENQAPSPENPMESNT